MKKLIIISLIATTAHAAAPTPAEIAHGQLLLNARYEKLKTLYSSNNPFKRQWFRPVNAEHLNKRLAIATAKGDATLAAQISKQGSQNFVERIVPHKVWEYKTHICYIALLYGAGSIAINSFKNSLPICNSDQCSNTSLHSHVDCTIKIGNEKAILANDLVFRPNR